MARISRNQRFTAQSTATRYGHSTRLQIGAANNSLTGGGLLRYLAALPGTLSLQALETILLFAYGSVDGNVYACPPFLQGALVTLTNEAFFSNTGFTAFPGLNPVMVQAFNKLFVSLSSLLLPSQNPMVYNPTDGVLYPASDLPFGAPWQPNTFYRVGQVISPSTFQTFGMTDGEGTWVETPGEFLFQCTHAGTSGSTEPVWSGGIPHPRPLGTPLLGSVATVGDGTVIWTEATPVFISGLPDPPAPTVSTTTVNSGSPILSTATVYLACTYTNSIGEGINQITNVQGVIDSTRVLTWKNTTGNAVNLSVVLSNIPAILATSGPLGATYGATGINLYAFIDQDSSADPSQIVDPAYYALVNSTPATPGTVQVISAFPAGQQLPQTSTAETTATVGNVDTGIRYLTVCFQTNTVYQTGFSNSAPQAVNVTQSGWPIQCLQLPIGPYNTQARIIGATVSGASAAGPFTYISQADIESPGFNQPNVQITATLIPDNTSTTALLNFTDTYLPGASDITNYFDIIQIPPSVDVCFLKSLSRTAFTGAVGYQSGHLLSDIGQPEMVRVPGGNFQVSESDGDRTVCMREIRGIPYSFKENSGYEVIPNGGDPSTWLPRKVWGGNGPVGPLAIDIAGQDDSEFAVWAHRSGLYLFTGSAPQLISREQGAVWDTINWDYGHLIKVRIDHTRRLIHILAPINGSTTCNVRFVLNYYFGTGDPVVFVQRRGILVPNVEGRKWSQDDLTFNDALYIPQKSANAVQVEGLDVENQMVFFSADGSVKTMTDGQYFDEDYNGNQVGYFSNWIGVLGQTPGSSYDKLVGARMWATGNGLCNVTAYDDNDNPYILTGPESPYILTPGTRTRMDIPSSHQGVTSQRWAVGMDNGGIAGAWWEVYRSDLMVIPMWPGLPG